MRKFVFLALLLLIFLGSAYAQSCEVARAKDVLRKNVYAYLTSPSSSPLTIEELKDLLTSYLSISAGAATFDCSVPGPTSGSIILTIINNGDAAPNIIPACTDNTKYGECSNNKPKFCYAGSLVSKCGSCGCAAGYSCKADGGCVSSGSNITCSSNVDCGQSRFTGNYYCSNSYIARDFINYTCSNAGNANSSCMTPTYAISLAYCNPNQNQSCTDGSSSCKITTLNQSCTDGTAYSQCSATIPLYCSNGTLVNSCPSCGCSGNQTCLGTGACQQPESCTDSDGVNPFIFGYAYGMQNGTIANQTDACASNTTLTERTCSGTKINSTLMACSNLCFNNSCINQTNQNPVAVIYVNVSSGKAPLAVRFNGTLSYDPDGAITSHSWLFGDGSQSSSALIVHNYTNIGIYIVNLTVTDSQGGTGTGLQTINVISNQNPVSIIQVNLTTGINQTVRFNGSASYDIDGAIIKYNWSFGNGNSSNLSSLAYRYPLTGTYIVNLTVKDNNLAVGSSTQLINVS